MRLAWLFLALLLPSVLFTSCTAKQDVHQAAFQGDIAQVRSYVAAGGRVDTLLENTSLLRNATEGGHVELMKYLIAHGANEQEVSDGEALIHEAARSKNVQAAAFLLERGADVNSKTVEGKQTPVLYAAMNADYAMVAYLIQKGAQLNGQDAFAGTPLIEAISSGYDAANAGQRLQLVKVLVDHGADVNLGDNRGTTPIAVAALYEHKAIVEYLVQHGAAVNSRGEEGHTAFSFAAYKANQGLCEYFVAFGARPHERLDDGSTAVMHALRSNDVAFLRWLIPQYRYNVQDRDSSGQTLLMYAVQNQGMATTPYVVNELGLDVNARDHRGRTPLMFTAGSLELDKIRFLVEKGSQVNAQDQQGMTTIMHIAENVNFGDSSPPNDAQSYEAIKYLKSRGGRIDIRSKSGRLALDYLQDKPFPELIALLK